MKTMKSTMARLFALCLTVAMVLSMATMGAFAAPITSTTQTGSITITGSANDVGAEVSLYKIINVNMVNANGSIQPKDPVYTWEEAVGKWVAMLYPQYAKVIEHKTETEEGTTTTYTYEVTKAFSEANAAILGAFYHDLEGSGKLGTAAKTVKLESTSATISGVAMGQYLVTASKTGNTYNPATATLYPVWSDSSKSWELNDATVVLKSKGGIDKNVEGEKGDNSDLGYAVGDTVTYRLDVAIPVYPEDATATKFNVGDKMSHGLTWDKAVTVYWSEDGIMNTVEKGEGDNVTVVPDPEYRVDASNYALATPEDDPELAEDEITFEVRFDYKNLIKNCSGAKYVHVVYNATLNEDAFEEDALGNDAYVGVNTNPYDEDSYEKTEVEKEVYTYGINVTKVDAEDGVALLGAEFKLYSDAACKNEIKFVGANGTYTRAKNQEGESVTLSTNGLGQINLGGLDVGTYYLKEVKAPDGYQLPSDKDAVTTLVMDDTTGGTPNGADGNLDSGTATGSMVEENTTATNGNMLSFKLMNTKPGFELPTTGGMGTVLFTAGGLVIMACGAVLVLVTLKKKKAED